MKDRIGELIYHFQLSSLMKLLYLLDGNNCMQEINTVFETRLAVEHLYITDYYVMYFNSESNAYSSYIWENDPVYSEKNENFSISNKIFGYIILE